MRAWIWIGGLAIAGAASGTVLAQDAGTRPRDPEKDALAETVRRLEERVNVLEAEREPMAARLRDEPAKCSVLAEAVQSLQISGFAEVLFAHNLRGGSEVPGRRGDTIAHNQLRGPDADVDGFSFQTVQVLVEKPLGGQGSTGFRVRADYGNLAELAATDPNFDGGAGSDAFDVRDAYFNWRTPWGCEALPIDLAAGKFRSPLGFEVLENTENWLVTRNPINVFGTPTTHTGVRLSGMPVEKITANLYLVNGWDDVVDANEGKTAILNLVLGRYEWQSSQVQLNVSWGKLTGARQGDEQRLLEIVWDGKFTEDLEFALDAIDGSQPERDWHGAAFYLRQKLIESANLSARVGCYDDDALGTDGAEVWDFSIAAIFTVATGLTASLEFRHDWSDDDPFLSRAGEPADEQDTVTLSLIARF